MDQFDSGQAARQGYLEMQRVFNYPALSLLSVFSYSMSRIVAMIGRLRCSRITLSTSRLESRQRPGSTHPG